MPADIAQQRAAHCPSITQVDCVSSYETRHEKYDCQCKNDFLHRRLLSLSAQKDVLKGGSVPVFANRIPGGELRGEKLSRECCYELLAYTEGRVGASER